VVSPQSDAVFDLHGILRIRIRGLSSSQISTIFPELPPFEALAQATPGEAQILFEPLVDQPELPDGAGHLRLVELGGERCLVLCRAGQADLLMRPEEPLRIQYTARKRMRRRLHSVLLVALRVALVRQHGLFFHGAGLTRDGRGLLLAGMRGSGKTQINLALLHHGWAYLADDKSILHGGRLHQFDPIVWLGPQHLQTLDWLAPMLPPQALWGTGRFVSACRSRMAAVGARLLPKRLAAAWSRAWSIRIPLNAQQQFPGPPAQNITDVVLVEAGGPTRIEPIGEAEAIERLAQIQSRMFDSLQQMDQQLLGCYGDPGPPLKELLQENLAGRQFLRIGIQPGDDGPAQAADEILQALC